MKTLYIAATPIGNLEDISIRTLKILLQARIIVCEDTRRTGMLIKLLVERYKSIVDSLQVSVAGQRKYISLRDWNEDQTVGQVLAELVDSEVVLVSDAGTPLISDPGFKLVRAARQAEAAVVPLPGACAAVAAISVSGLPTNKFMFWGFLPRKWDLQPKITHIIYESPIRTEETIKEIMNRYPLASVVVAQELTKMHESVREYSPGMKFKGEVTLMVYWESEN